MAYGPSTTGYLRRLANIMFTPSFWRNVLGYLDGFETPEAAQQHESGVLARLLNTASIRFFTSWEMMIWWN